MKMSKAAEMAKITAKSSFHYLWGLVASTVISAISTIYIANLLTPDQLGLYTLAIGAPTIIGLFRDLGVTAAITRYTAQNNAQEQTTRIKTIIVAGLTFELAAGIILTVIGFLLSTLFAYMYQAEAITPLIQIASLTILINAFLTVPLAVFTGLERMELTSITLTIQSITKLVFVPVLVIIGLGVYGATAGNTIAHLISGVAATLLLWLVYKRLLRPTSSQAKLEDIAKSETKNNITMLIKYGLPLSIGNIIGSFQTQFYTVLMGIYVSKEAVGNYSLAATFVVLITFFATPIATMLFPAFSKLDPLRDKGALKSVYQFSVKYAALIVVPIAVAVMALSQPGVSSLFGNKYATSPLFLALLSLTYVYTAFGSLSVYNLINGQGKTDLTLKLTLLTAAIGFPLSIVLAMQLGVMGIIIASLTCGLPSLIISLRWTKKHYDLTIDWVASVKILFSSAIAGTATYLLQTQLSFSSWIALIIGTTAFIAVFFPLVTFTGTINRTDLENLRQMTTSIGGPVNRLLKPALNLVEKLLTLVNKPSAEAKSQPASEELPF